MTGLAAPLAAERIPPRARPAWRWPWAGLSAALHLGVIAALLFWPTGRNPPSGEEEPMGVALVFADSETEAPVEDQTGMVLPSAPETPPPVPDQPLPPQPDSTIADLPQVQPPPPLPRVEAPPRPDAPPPPVPEVQAPPRPDAPPPPPIEAPRPPRALAQAEPPSPPPPPLAPNFPAAPVQAELPPAPPEAPVERAERRALPRVFQPDLDEEPPAWERWAALPRVIEPELVEQPPPREEPPEPPPEPQPEQPRPQRQRTESRASPPQRQGRPGQQAAAATPPSPAIPGPDRPVILGGGIATGAVVPPSIDPGINNAPPAYPESSRRAGEQGVVGVTVTVGPDGRVTAVQVVRSSGFQELDQAALMAVHRWRFRPGMRDGVAVTSSIRTSVHFQLQGGRR